MALSTPLIDFPTTPSLSVMSVGLHQLNLQVTPIALDSAPVDAIRLKFKGERGTERAFCILRKFELVSVDRLQLDVQGSALTLAYSAELLIDLDILEPCTFDLAITGLYPASLYEMTLEAVNYLGSSPLYKTSLQTLSRVYSSLFVWGNNEDSRLGCFDSQTDPTYIKQPTLHPEIDERLSYIATGSNSIVAVTDEGGLLEWGTVFVGRENGQLEEITSPLVYIQPAHFASFTRVAVGNSFSLALSVTGQIYSWGLGQHNELGHGDILFLSEPTLIHKTNQGPTPFFKDIACGMSACCASTISGHLYEWGFVVEPFNSRPVVLDIPTRLNIYDRVTGVRAGGNSRVAHVEDGSVFTWGLNLVGELGHGSKDIVALPRKVEGLSRVIDVACGFEHTLFCTQAGNVWACGLGKKGELGIGDCKSYSTPQCIPSLNSVKSVAAGLKFSLFLLESGEVYACGEGKNCCLGLGVPGKASAPRSLRFTASSISAGLRHSLALIA